MAQQQQRKGDQQQGRIGVLRRIWREKDRHNACRYRLFSVSSRNNCLKLNFRWLFHVFTSLFTQVEENFTRETKIPRDEVAREGLDRVVVFRCSAIEETAGRSQFVFNIAQFFLQLQKILITLGRDRLLPVPAIPGGRWSTACRSGNDLSSIERALRPRTGPRLFLSATLFVGGVTPLPFPPVGNEVVLLPQLHINVSKGILPSVAQPNQRIVGPDYPYKG